MLSYITEMSCAPRRVRPNTGVGTSSPNKCLKDPLFQNLLWTGTDQRTYSVAPQE